MSDILRGTTRERPVEWWEERRNADTIRTRFLMQLTPDMTTPDARGVISPEGKRLLQLQLACDVGPVRLRSLLRYFGSPDAVLDASRAELERTEGIGPKTAEAIRDARDAACVDHEIARATELGVRIVSIADPDYPKALLQTPDAPACLFIKGTLQPQDAVAIAIVGTRRCSHYGREQAVRFGELLGAAGFTVISGLARGIDGDAHSGAIRGQGRTIAVLGNGLASVYPPEHAALAERITRCGALISELPVDATPEAKNFPGRNRVIAGLALGVIVVEAGERSGALITARHALDYNREVFAVPGRVDNPGLTAGVNGLIRDGTAKLITGLDDVLDELREVGDIMRHDSHSANAGAGATADDDSVRPRLPAHEQVVVDAVRDGSELADAIADATELALPRVLTALTSLELKGLVRRLPGDRFALRQS